MHNYRKLECWQRSHEACLAIYEATRSFPTEEKYGLRSQIRRAAVSVGSNLAEGSGRGTNTDFARFVDMALGSLQEVDYQLLLANDLGLLESSSYQALDKQVQLSRVSVYRFSRSLKRQP